MGRRLALNVQVGDCRPLYFEALVKWVSSTHIYFEDKKGLEYGFRIVDVTQFCPLEGQGSRQPNV